MKFFETAELYDVKAGDTLEKIAKAKCPSLGWKRLALYNWGASENQEILRALIENVGVELEDYAPDLEPYPAERVKLTPDPDLQPKVKIPKVYERKDLKPDRKIGLKIRPCVAANTVSLERVDAWFLPGKEACDVAVRLEGEIDTADALELEIYASNYCTCTDWNAGVPKFTSPADLVDEPVYKKSVTPGLRMQDTVHWTGETTTTKGPFSCKVKPADKRYVNVAFSPYTVHLRYFKTGESGDAKARIALEPFWLAWNEKEEKPTVTHAAEGAGVKLSWTHAKPVLRGAVRITDARGELVHFAVLPADKLGKGAQTHVWDGTYRAGVVNGNFQPLFEDDSGVAGLPACAKNTPYVYEVAVMVAGDKPFRSYPPQDNDPGVTSPKIRWEIKNTTRLERGLLQITNRHGQVVFQKALKKDLVAQGKHEIEWKDGKYAKGFQNSKDTDVAIPEDMPYRVQIQAHTATGAEKGLALAAMDTEVRLAVRRTTFEPRDCAHDPEAKNSLKLALGPLLVGAAPPSAANVKYFQHKLGEHGFHPGPVTGTANPQYQAALKEFKRSVPRHNPSPGPAHPYLRLTLKDNPVHDEDPDADTLAALDHMDARRKRRWFGSPTRVGANNDGPDLSDDEVRDDLGDPGKDVIVWADDRQYYTEGENEEDPTGARYFRNPFHMSNYRGEMEANALADLNRRDVPRPWIPLQVEPVLARKGKGLADDPDDPDTAARAAMRAALGPLRVDWDVDELPPDYSPIDTAHANYDREFVRSRAFVRWTLHENKLEHDRPDTKRKAIYTNCPDNLGGIRPTTGKYAEAAFGTRDLSVPPWKATAVDATESVATVAHDHANKDQKDEASGLFAGAVGLAAAAFRPSVVGGDGYRARARLVFAPFGDYNFPNLKVLAARYPAAPSAHTSRLRVWKRSALRGHACWGAPSGNWPAMLDGLRAYYKQSHVYFVHELGAATHFDLDDTVISEAQFKEIVARNCTRAAFQNRAHMRLKRSHVWPWSERPDFGWSYRSSEGALDNDDIATWLGKIEEKTWDEYACPLLMALLTAVEKKGHLRGHLLVEFTSSSAFVVERYRCDNAAHPHTYHYVSHTTAGASRKAGAACPAPGCGSAGHVLALAATLPKASLPLSAVGEPLGATWLYWRGEQAHRIAPTWAHELGHHRHMEHASIAPGAVDDLHDSRHNDTVAWAGLPEEGNPAATRWDRRCLMSYCDVDLDEEPYPCGKCILRTRGWSVRTLACPTCTVVDPPPPPPAPPPP